MADKLSRVELLRLARLGAASRLAEIRREIASLERLVGGGAPPERKGRGRKRGKRKAAPVQSAPSPTTTAAPARKTSAWSAAARRAVSLRMKKYWAARRQAKKR